MWFKLLILVHVCISFPLKCPEPAQWARRANGHCADPSKYFCLKNDLIKGYSENCTRSDFQQPGRKAVLRGGIDADVCSLERYQPFPIKFFTNASTNCMFSKSFCNEDGQVVYDPGNRNTDTTCRCDYRQGYEFIVKPNNPCFCEPSQEDCSCYLKICSNTSQILSPDYQCIDKTDLTIVAQCRYLPDENGNSSRRPEITYNIPDVDNISFPVTWQKHSAIAVLSLFGGIIVVVLVLSINMYRRYRLRALTIKGPGENIRLIEGQSFELQYILPTNRFRLIFLKNKSKIAEKEHVEKNVYHIRKVAPTDEGSYCAKVGNIRSKVTQLTVQSMFTSSFEQIYCIEGEELQLKCSVYSASIEVDWFKDNLDKYKQDKIERNTNISIDHNGKDHVLTIQNAKITDSGKYIIIAGNVRKQLPVIVKAFFKRPLENKTIMEGVEVSFECEAEKTYNVSYPVEWFKDNHKVNPSSKFKIETLGNKVHKLTIQPTTLEDKGKYWIEIKDIQSCADLDVKEMPDAVKQMSEHDRNMFLKAAKTGTAVRYYIRIMIVGENGVGKTCLLRRLMNEHIDDVKSTDGINIEVKKCKINRLTQKWIFPADEEFAKTTYQNEDFADCGFWDFAGQKEFYATHQTFLSTNAIYLLVVDISKDFASKTHQAMIDNKFDKVGEYIDFWLDYIHCYALQDKDDLLNPPVIIVGTGIDKLKNEEEISEKENMLYSLLGDHKKRRHIRKLYFLSNTKPENYKTEFENLRKEIFEVAGNIPKWGDNLPTRWIVLEKEIDRQIAEKKPVISYEEAEQIAKISSFPDSEIGSELDSFLKYEHEIGNLIFFDDIKSYIVLEPKWLVDIFKCFVSPFIFQKNFVEMTEWKKLELTGILPDSLIKKLFKKVPGFDSVKLSQFALQVMEKFDIIVKPTTLNGNEEYYMPCMINASDFETITQIFNVQSKNCSRSSWFCLNFNFLPPSFFNHLLVTLVKNYVLCTDQDGGMQLYRGIGIFNLEKNGCQKLVACLSENAIAVQVWEYHNEEQHISNANYSNIREYLISIVHLLQRRYKINIQYECFFKCPDGKYYKTAGKVSCDETGENYFCPEHGSTHSLEDVRKIWLQDEKDENTGKKNNNQVKCHYCEKIPVYRCYECSNVLCDGCSNLRHDVNAKKHHSLQSMLLNSKFEICDVVIDHSLQSTSDKMLLNYKFEISDVVIDMKALQGGLLVIALFANKKLLTYSVSDKQRNEISVGGRPCSIAIVDRNTVVVLLSCDTLLKDNSIEIVNIRQRQVIQHVDVTIFLSSYLFSPMFYTDDQLFISSRSGITVMDMSGTIDREIDLGFKPKDMCYDAKASRIYCITHLGEKIISIDRDGNTIFTFTDTGLTNAERLTIDNKGYALILCHGGYTVLNFNVHRLSPDGKSGELIITGNNNKNHKRDFSSICYQEESSEVVIGVYKTVNTYKKN